MPVLDLNTSERSYRIDRILVSTQFRSSPHSRNTSATNPETERHLSDEPRNRVQQAWQEARDDIFSQWHRQVEPWTVQPDGPKILREVEEHLSEHAPTNTEEGGAERAAKSVGAPLSRREQHEFREIYDDDGLGPVEMTNLGVGKGAELGLEPFESPNHKPRIRKEAIQVICWVAISEEETPECGGLEEQETLEL